MSLLQGPQDLWAWFPTLSSLGPSLSIHPQSQVSVLCQHWVAEIKSPALAFKGPRLVGLMECRGFGTTEGAQLLPNTGVLPSGQGEDPRTWLVSPLPQQLPPTRAPPPCVLQGRARGSGPRLPGIGGESPPDGCGVGHESLRFSFSEQRVFLNCL